MVDQETAILATAIAVAPGVAAGALKLTRLLFDRWEVARADLLADRDKAIAERDARFASLEGRLAAAEERERALRDRIEQMARENNPLLARLIAMLEQHEGHEE